MEKGVLSMLARSPVRFSQVESLLPTGPQALSARVFSHSGGPRALTRTDDPRLPGFF